MTADGLLRIASAFSPKETADRLEQEIRDRGLTLFARIDHAAGAKAAGLELRPTELLVFGNAKGGTPLMQVAQEMGIDLPLKALVYQDGDGKVWIAWNDPAWLAARHHVSGQPVVAALTKNLEAIAAGAAG